VIRRPGVVLDREELLADERREDRVQPFVRQAAERGDRLARERLAEHGSVLEKGALPGRQAVEARGDQSLERLGHVELDDGAGELVAIAVGAREQTLVEQHPHGLDGVQRHALGPIADPHEQVAGETRHHPVQQLLDRHVRQSLEVERGEPALARSPVRTTLGDLGTREREHEQRMVAPPLNQVVDEVEQRVVGPLEVLEDHHHRSTVGDAFEEQAPAGEQVVARGARAFFQPEEMREPRLDPSTLLGIGDELLDAGVELLGGGRGRLVLRDPSAGAHHLRERPVRDAVAVREASTAMPPDHVDQSVDVLQELPRQARLADPSDPDHGEQVRAALVGARVEEILQQPELAVAADERRLEPGGPELAAAERDHANRAREVDRLGLPLELVCARVLVDERGFGHVARGLRHEHRARLGGGLHARGRVHQVSGHEPLALGAERDRGLPGGHAGPRGEVRCADVGAERSHGLDKIEAGPDRSFRVVLLRHGRAPYRHDGVADELLDGPAVAIDQRARRVEVARQELADLFGVARLGERGEADQVGEEHRDELALGDRGGPVAMLGARGGGGDAASERAAALAAEPVVRLVRRAAARAGDREGRAARRAELPPGPVLGPAHSADHDASLPAPSVPEPCPLSIEVVDRPMS